MPRLFFAVIFMLFSSVASAELKKEMIEYNQGDTALEGYVVYFLL